MFEICKMRKNCIICDNPIFKNEDYFRTYDKGKSICIHCLIDAQQAIENKLVWAKHTNDFDVILNEDYDKHFKCIDCGKKVNIGFVKFSYSYNYRTYRRWVTSWATSYLCKDCLDKFIAYVGEDGIALSKMNRLERAIINL